MDGGHELNPGADPVAWLARQLCTANVLLLIHHGDPAAARSAITSSAAGYVGVGNSYHVHGGQVAYRLDGSSGRVRVSRLVDAAAARHHPAVGEQLADAYRRYVQAATSATTSGRGEDRVGVIDELRRCEQLWWQPRPGEQLDLFAVAVERSPARRRTDTPRAGPRTTATIDLTEHGHGWFRRPTPIG